MRIAEADDHAGLLRQFLVHRHLATLVVGQTLPHWLDNAVEIVREGLQYIGGADWLVVRQHGQNQQPAGALDQGTYCACIAGSSARQGRCRSVHAANRCLS